MRLCSEFCLAVAPFVAAGRLSTPTEWHNNSLESTGQSIARAAPIRESSYSLSCISYSMYILYVDRSLYCTSIETPFPNQSILTRWTQVSQLGSESVFIGIARRMPLQAIIWPPKRYRRRCVVSLEYTSPWYKHVIVARGEGRGGRDGVDSEPRLLGPTHVVGSLSERILRAIQGAVERS